MSVQDHLCSARIPTPVLTGLLIPASLLIILAIVPPHAFDLSVSKLFFSDGWPWHRNEVFTTIFYRLPKLVPAIVATVLLVRLAVVLAQGRRILEEEASRRALYVVIAMGACAAAVWWLKSTTGVACPWSVEPFGGALPMTDPAFGLTDVPGRCWPSGHAGTGFVFIAFYFALKDVRPRAAAGALLFAVAFGLLCGAVRVMEGAHFVSHVLVTGIVDWLICAALHALILEDRSSPAFAKPLSERGLVLLTAFWLTFVLNMPFLARAADLSEPNFAWSMREALTLAGLSFGLLFISIALLTLVMALPRPVRRAVLVLLSLTGAIFFAGTLVYGIAFDPNMARNVISTDVHEASAYFSARTLLLALAAGLPPVLAASAADMTPAGLRPAAVRGGVAILALAAGAGALFTQMNTLAAVMRNDKALRYLITPVNVPYSLAATLARDASPDAAQKRIVDPKPEFSVRLSRPAVLLVVIGETTRSASWGLAGYARDTTPALRAEGVISHPSVTACGSSTDVSLPCMLSRIGRSDYDRSRIIGEEALPSLLARAGAHVVWVDNQSGCKGTCAGTEVRSPDPKSAACASGRCFDGVLLDELDGDLANLPADRPTVLFYHMYGEHGPRYHADSPAHAKVWTPECTDADLGACTKESIINAYDNAVRYTDGVLAGLVKRLKARTDIDAGFVYVSDHGESLGEGGLYLHGAPYFMAPSEQIRVPMVMWLSKDWSRTFGFDAANLAREPAGGVTHEHLYSTVLGMLGVQSTTRHPRWDLTDNRSSAAQ